MRKDAKRLAELMALLSNENRLLILETLLDGPRTVGEIAQQVPDITAPALSQHLQKLRAGNMIRAEKQAQYVRYSICDANLRDLMDFLRQKYCTESAAQPPQPERMNE